MKMSRKKRRGMRDIEKNEWKNMDEWLPQKNKIRKRRWQERNYVFAVASVLFKLKDSISDGR